MSLKAHLFWRSLCMLSVFLSAWCVVWIGREFYVWQKPLALGLACSWWNWVGLFAGVLGVAFTSYIDDLIGFEESKDG